MEIKTESLDYSFTFMAMSSYKMEGLMSKFYSISQNMGPWNMQNVQYTIWFMYTFKVIWQKSNKYSTYHFFSINQKPYLHRTILSDNWFEQFIIFFSSFFFQPCPTVSQGRPLESCLHLSYKFALVIIIFNLLNSL